MPILFITIVIDLIGFGIIIPIIPFLGLKLELNTIEIGLLIAIYSLFSGLLSPFWGKLSDRYGRKPIILICLTGGAVAYVALALSTTFWSILAARALAGAMAGNFGVATAIIADISTPENRAKSMGMIGAAFGLGMTIGPFLGGLLAGDKINMLLPSLVAASLSCIAVVAAFFYLKESLPPEKRLSNRQRQEQKKYSNYHLLKQTKNRWLSFQYFLHNHSVSLFSYLFPLWIASTLNWGPKETGIIFGIQGILIITIQGALIGPLVNFLGEMKLLFVGIILISFGYTLAIFANNNVLILAAFYISITGATFCMPILSAILSKRTPEQLRGQIMGTATSLSAWGRMAAPISGGIILNTFGYTYAWSFGVLIALIYLLWVIKELWNDYNLQKARGNMTS